MNPQMYPPLTNGLFLLSMFISGIAARAQMSYEEFHSRYKPTYETITPDLGAVTLMNESDAPTGVAILELLMQQYEADNNDDDSRLKVIAILTSSKRDVVAKALAAMNTATAVKVLAYVNDNWVREVMYFVDKTTYHNVAPYLTAITDWDGPTGPLGPPAKTFSPAYAGIGLDLGYGFYKGMNTYIDAYNGWTTKGNGPFYYIDEPIKNLGGTKGFSVQAALNIMNKKKDKANFLEFNYQNRSAKGKGGGQLDTPWTKHFKFNTQTFNLSFLTSKGLSNKTIRFYHGWGLHFQTGSGSEKASIYTPFKWDKEVKGINVGFSYNLGLMINPFKELPLMFGIRGNAHFNFLKYDASPLESNSPQLAWGGGDPEDLESVMNIFGGGVQVLYKFGKADNTVYPDFNTEVAAHYDSHINTTYTEILPIISPDGHTLYFIRSDHPQNTKGSYASQDLWIADVKNGTENAKATHMMSPFNKEQYNMIAGVSPDGNAMLIKGFYNTAGELQRGYSMIYRTRDGWSKPENLKLDSYAEMSQGKYTGAYWTQDGKHLILSFSEKSGDDLQDLYVSHLKDDGSYSKPVKLGSKINSDAGDEHSPFMASDGKTLYFSSNMEGGSGNNDIYMTKRLDDTWTNWSDPVNLGSEVNTEEWDAYYSIDAQGQYAYMASGKNSKGKEDIVRIKLKEEVQPDPVVLIRGKVLNAKTKEPIDAKISYNGLDDGKNYGVARTNPATGEYTIVLPYGKNYDFTAASTGFIGVSDNLDLTSIGEYKEITRDLYLVPIEVGATVRLNNIFFETGKAELKPTSYIELARVVIFMNDNPNVKIEMSGHTDNVGDKVFNKSLSQQRAEAVFNYLIAAGILKERIKAMGYGMEKPVADNATDDGKALNRRVEFTILAN